MLQYLNPELAQELVLEHTPTLRPRLLPCAEALGLVLAESIAPTDQRFGAGLKNGTTVSPFALGALAAAGKREVRVFPPPNAAVVQISPERAPALASGQMVAALLKQAGVQTPQLLQAFDTFEDLSFVVDHVLRADLVLFVGVELSSVASLQRVLSEIQATIILDNLSQEPGGHFCLAARGARLLFGLAAAPMAAALCFEHYVAPAIDKMMGRRSESATFTGRLMQPLEVEVEQTRLLPASTTSRGGDLEVTPLLNGNRNAPANSYLMLPPGDHTLPHGSEVEGWWMTGLRNVVVG